MRLLTHNMLQCPRTKAHPLSLVVLEAEEVEVDFSQPFIERMVGRLNWKAFREASAAFTEVDVPVDPPTAATGDTPEEVWRAIHRALLEWRVVRGTLKAPDGTTYDIKDGVPNLIIAEAVQPTTADDPNMADRDADDGDGDGEEE